MSEQTNTRYVTPMRVQHGELKPEWLSVIDATKVFGIGRSRLYELISAGRIKSRSLKARGSIRGRRLISFDSLSAYIENCES